MKIRGALKCTYFEVYFRIYTFWIISQQLTLSKYLHVINVAHTGEVQLQDKLQNLASFCKDNIMLMVFNIKGSENSPRIFIISFRNLTSHADSQTTRATSPQNFNLKAGGDVSKYKWKFQEQSGAYFQSSTLIDVPVHEESCELSIHFMRNSRESSPGLGSRKNCVYRRTRSY